MKSLLRTSDLVESCYVHAKEFVPERWYSKPDMIKNKIAYAPFALGLQKRSQLALLQAGTDKGNTGRYSCIGKTLALQELRCVTALLASKYDVGFPPGEDGKSVEEDTLDQFTSNPGELKVVFRARQKS